MSSAVPSPLIEMAGGVLIPQLGFGTYKATSSEAYSSVRAALDAGYRHIDTAEMYGNEPDVGRAIADSGLARDEVFITSKLNNPFHEPAAARRSFAQTLEDLQVEAVDLFLIHWPMAKTTDYVATWRTMLEFQADGRARAVGVSNFEQKHLRAIIDATGVKPALNQIEIHPYLAQRELVDFDTELGIVTASWSPLGRGALLTDPVLTSIADELGRSIVSFLNHACVAGSYYESVNGISGGGLKLAQAFEAQLKKTGVEIYCGQGVTGILLSSDGALSGVALDGGTEISAGCCISTIHPRRLLEIVPHSVFRPAYMGRLRELEETASASILYAVCSEAVEELEGSNLFIFPEPDFSFFRDDMSVEKRPMYITAAGERSDGQKSKQGLIAISPMSQQQTEPLVDPLSQERSHDYSLLKEEIAEKMMFLIKKACPEIARKITDVTCATPLTLRDYTNSPFGSLYGVKHKMGQYNPVPVTRLRGLFLAGQATTAPGIMGAMMSGFLACGSILGHDVLQKELKQCRPEE